MPLLSVKTSKKIDTNVRLEQSTAKNLDRYAHFVKSSADDVVNEALEYIFTKDKEFQQHLQQNPDVEVPTSLRVKKVPPSVAAARNGGRNGSAALASSTK